MGGRNLNRIRIVSFDLDGTITEASFVESVWLEGIPRLYALKKHISVESAKRHIETEYNKVGREKLEWYDLHHWIQRFGLNTSPAKILNEYRKRIRTYPEVPRILQQVSDKGFRLIVITNARREFADLELEKTDIARYFERVFSSTSDFGLIKNSISIYRRVCDVCGIVPKELLHIGDDRVFDFEIPNKLGIQAYFLDRTARCKGKSVIHSLTELNEKLHT
jgi:HAD superfamily hydrolase (TIGR01549 family)